MDSDGANNALQGWDLLHGHLLLHGWILGDATYYSFELPLYAITEAVIGLSSLTGHVVSALTYLIVAACAVVLATAGSKGLSRALRGAAVIAVLGSPLLTLRGVSILLSAPDHTGTSAIMMGSFLLIDRVPGGRFTPPLLCAILCAGQIGDATVRYVAVPAILLVCAYRIAAARKIKTPDTAILLAAAASVVLAHVIRIVMQRLGAYAMVPAVDRDRAGGAMAASRGTDPEVHLCAVRGGRRPARRAGPGRVRLRADLPAGRPGRLRESHLDLAHREPVRAAAVRRDPGRLGART